MSYMIAAMWKKRKEDYPAILRVRTKHIYQPETQSSTGLDYAVQILLKCNKSI